MKKILLSITLLLLSGVASATVINFDVDGFGNPIVANTAITNQYANLGVHFLGLEDGNAVDLKVGPEPDGGSEPSPPLVLTNCDDTSSLFCPGGRADIVRITFDTAVQDVSLQLDTLGGASVTFNLYDALDNLLETQTITSGGSLFVPVTFSATGISRIDGLQPFDGWAWAMDDLTFTSVPAPSSLLLVIMALGAVGARKLKA